MGSILAIDGDGLIFIHLIHLITDIMGIIGTLVFHFSKDIIITIIELPVMCDVNIIIVNL